MKRWNAHAEHAQIMERTCGTCANHGTIDCPNSSLCLAVEGLPNWEYIDTKKMRIRYALDGIKLDRLEAICKAERDGVLKFAQMSQADHAELTEYRRQIADGLRPLLPCKVGDTVYAVVHCDEIQQICDNDYFEGTGATSCPFQNDCTYEDCDDSNLRVVETTVTGFWNEDNCWNVFLDYICADLGVSDFGKTVFLTREAALKAREGN